MALAVGIKLFPNSTAF